MNVLLVTSWNTPCGIADHSQQLIDAVRAADPTIQITPSAEALDPQIAFNLPTPDVLVLNYHRALHSRWTPERVQEYRMGNYGMTVGRPLVKIVIIFHDTYGESEPDQLTKDLCELADAFIVHEPCVGLPQAIYWRQGVPAPARSPGEYGVGRGVRYCFKRYHQQPVLGTCGFNFPWKNYDHLAEVSHACGWGLVICSNNATEEDEARWTRLNPDSYIVRGFLRSDEIVQFLSGCDATIFAYECANSGTSGAIRLGLAARKPLIAWQGCRQFRDLLYGPDQGAMAIRWCQDFYRLPETLRRISIQRCDPGIVALAERDSWVHLGQRYAELFRRVVSQ